MFGLIVRVISFFCVSVFFSILVFSSFLQKENDTNMSSMNDIVSYSGTFLEYSSSISQRKEISLFETLFSSSSLFVYQDEGAVFTLDVSQTGSYLSSLRDMKKQYIFEGKNFRILQKGIGEVYVDVGRNPEKIFLFPLNTSLEIELLGEDGKEVYTKMFLSPHMYVEMDLKKINSLKNADALRVQNLFRLGYVATNLSELGTYPILQAYGVEKDSFFFTALKDIKYRDSYFQKYIQTLEEQSVIKVIGSETIARYSQIFINSEKKVVFYKNTILAGYLQLLQEQKFVKEDIQKIQKDLDTLLELDPESHETMLLIQTYIRASLFSSSQKEHILPKLSFSSLAIKDFSQTQGFFYIYSHALFHLYDVQGEYDGELIRRFLQSFTSYIPQTQDGDTPLGAFQYEYFLFFLKHQLSFLLNQSSEMDQMEAITSTLKNYIDISENSLDEFSPTARITSLYIYDEILQDIEIFLRTEYFMSDRTSEGLLTLSDKKIGLKQLTAFKKETERIFKIYKTFEQTLDKNDARDTNISKNISRSILQIGEYLLAIENYQSYTSQYDLAAKNLLITEDGNSLDGVLEISIAQDFLSRFLGLDVSTAQITLQEGYYEVQSMYISGKHFSFDLYPYTSYYKIKNIFIDNIEQKFVYNLDIPSLSLDDTSPESSDFFLRTFFASNYTEQKQDYVVEEKKREEDKNIIVFKRERLLGEKGEFSSLANILPIGYDQIQVQKTSTGHAIFIEEAPVNSTALSGYKVLLNAQYMLDTPQKLFQDIRVTLVYDQSESFVLGNDPITVIGKVPLGETAVFLEDLLLYLSDTVSLYNSIQSKYRFENLLIQYSPLTQKMTFKFDSQGKKYTIFQVGDTVEKIYVGTSSVLQTPIKILNISNYLP